MVRHNHRTLLNNANKGKTQGKMNFNKDKINSYYTPPSNNNNEYSDNFQTVKYKYICQK